MRTTVAVLVMSFALSATAGEVLFIFVPESVVFPAQGPLGAMVTFDVSAGGTDDPNPVVACEPASGSTFAVGVTPVRCAASDNLGHTAEASFSVIVYDATPPVLTLPGRITVTVESADGARVTYDATAVDDVDGPLAVHCVPPSGSWFAAGETRVVCVAADRSRNRTEDTFLVDVVRTSELALHVPEPITIEAQGPDGSLVEFVVTTSGSVDPEPQVSCAPESGAAFPLGVTPVHCRATDAFGGADEDAFDVRVVDTTPPSLFLERPTVESIDGSDVQVFFDAIATDLVDGSVAIVCAPQSGSQFPLGMTSVDCLASDRAGNTAFGSTLVSVIDGMPPMIRRLSVSPEVIEEPTGGLVPLTIDARAVDAIDPMPVCVVGDVSANEEIDIEDWQLDGDLALSVRAETNGADDRRYDIVIACRDDFGNTALGDLAVIVRAPSSSSAGAAQPPPPAKRRSVRP